ncbi:hypothetical protein RIF29_00658 [Crotalaria pallida]|uniref:FHA domain-containing protein n=1 Tax=Crotalaria pallida TaxID=3830 RepID=A0AAN9IVT5_CROPI
MEIPTTAYAPHSAPSSPCASVPGSAPAPASPCASVPDSAPAPTPASAPASAAAAIAEKKFGFAKLQGVDFEYYMKKYSILLGRNSSTSKVDVDLADLGGGTAVSRYHARIFYDFPRRRFSLEVLGRNGCYLEGVLYLPGNPPVKLDSQDHLRIGQKEFYFLLPSRGITRRPTPFHAPPPMAPPLAGAADVAIYDDDVKPPGAAVADGGANADDKATADDGKIVENDKKKVKLEDEFLIAGTMDFSLLPRRPWLEYGFALENPSFYLACYLSEPKSDGSDNADVKVNDDIEIGDSDEKNVNE